MPYDANGQYHADNQAGLARPNDEDSFWSQVPLLGQWGGSQGRMQAYQDAQRADANRGYWDSLSAPTAGQLDSRQGRDAESQALSQMQQWSSGAVTDADRAQLEASRSRDAQASGAAQRSLMQQAQARGVGGGGLDFATRQQASQQGQQQSSDAESQALAMAQQRGLAATQQSAQIGSTMRDEAAHGALQQSYEDQTQRSAGATGQYGTDANALQAGRDRRQQSDNSLLGFLSEL